MHMAEGAGASRIRRAGASGCEDGSVSWRVWAPAAREVTLVLMGGERRREILMDREPRGYHSCRQNDVDEGRRYCFRLDGGPDLPDPCSLWQPEGVFGPSAVVFPDRFAWSDGGWRGVRPVDFVFYEIHVGTFTALGTFDAMIPRLPDLVELGVTAVEIMPVGQFSGAGVGV